MIFVNEQNPSIKRISRIPRPGDTVQLDDGSEGIIEKVGCPKNTTSHAVMILLGDEQNITIIDEEISSKIKKIIRKLTDGQAEIRTNGQIVNEGIPGDDVNFF